LKRKGSKPLKRGKRQKEAAKEAAIEDRCEWTPVELGAAMSTTDFTIQVYNYYCTKEQKKYSAMGWPQEHYGSWKTRSRPE
jgi:hypothetical protein